MQQKDILYWGIENVQGLKNFIITKQKNILTVQWKWGMMV